MSNENLARAKTQKSSISAVIGAENVSKESVKSCSCSVSLVLCTCSRGLCV